MNYKELVELIAKICPIDPLFKVPNVIFTNEVLVTMSEYDIIELADSLQRFNISSSMYVCDFKDSQFIYSGDIIKIKHSEDLFSIRRLKENEE